MSKMNQKDAQDFLFSQMNTLINDVSIQAHLTKQEDNQDFSIMENKDKLTMLYRTYITRLVAYVAFQANIPYNGNIDLLTVDQLLTMSGLIPTDLTIGQLNSWWFMCGKLMQETQKQVMADAEWCKSHVMITKVCYKDETGKAVTRFIQRAPNKKDRYALVVTPKEATHEPVFNILQSQKTFVSAMTENVKETLKYDGIEAEVNILFFATNFATKKVS